MIMIILLKELAVLFQYQLILEQLLLEVAIIRMLAIQIKLIYQFMMALGY